MIDILQPGMLASVQDLGRSGHRSQGIHPGGALNALALASANLLVGNPVDAAGLEITMGVCRTALHPRHPHRPRWRRHRGHPRWQTHRRLLEHSGAAPAACCLAWRPRIAEQARATACAPTWLWPVASMCRWCWVRSTDLKAGFGGHQGVPSSVATSSPSATPAPPLRAVHGPAFGVRSPAGAAWPCAP
jgi:hypothetical protein